MKQQLYRAAAVIASLAVTLEALGAGRKWS